MRRYRPLPRRELAEVLEAIPSYRQSILAQSDNCLLSALFELEGYRYTNAAQARGIIFHRFAAELLRTLRQTGEVQIPVAEALAILYEVMAQRTVPDEDVVLPPAAERRLLRILAIKFASENRFTTSRIMAVEEQLQATISYPHPDGGTVERLVTGTPDALIADPPTSEDPTPGIIVPDWKTTRRAPPKGDAGGHWDDAEHISYQGYFQQRLYGLLVLRTFPMADRVKLREFYPLERTARYATIYRGDLEHLEAEFSVLLELLDRAIAGGSRSRVWQPSPGKHCSYCSRPQRCPLEADVRIREGGIATPAEARRAGAEYVVAKTVGSALHEALKAWVDAHGPVEVKSAKGRAQLRWRTNRGGGRTFGVYVPDDSDRGPLDPELEAAFREAADRTEEGATA